LIKNVGNNTYIKSERAYNVITRLDKTNKKFILYLVFW